MKKITLIFLLFSGFIFGQNKETFKTISYQDLITLFNSKLKLTNESLDENISRCNYIINEAKKKNDAQTILAFSVFLNALTDAKNTFDKNVPFITVFKGSDSNYEFFDNRNKFVGRIYKEKFEDTLYLEGDKVETFVSSYFYLLQD